MKASESSSNYIGKVRECTNYAVRNIKNLSKEGYIESRGAGSKAEAGIQKKLQSELESFSDSVKFESFSAKTKTGMITNIFLLSFIVLSSFSLIASTFITGAFLLVSIVLSILALISITGVFGGFAKSKQSANIFAKRDSRGVTTRRVIFCANSDAPYRRYFSKRAELILKASCAVGSALQLVYAVYIIFLAYNHFGFGRFMTTVNEYQDMIGLPPIVPILPYILSVFTLFAIALMFVVNYTCTTRGVVDNLVGCYTCTGAMRYLSELDIKLDHTEVCVLITGAKNADLAGATAYVQTNGDESKNLDTLIVCVDNIKDPESIGVLGGTSKGVKDVKSAAGNAGITLRGAKAKYLSSDVKAFSKAGINSALITTLPDMAPAYFQTTLDNDDLLNPKATEPVINILLESAYLMDSKK
ncbi:MAG: M28 family peptidase [Oscillospiraceae bacterium]|jgi:hypothetical protein|nr:M28 family peptidase [Oscillospiraceae bacterium]